MHSTRILMMLGSKFAFATDNSFKFYASGLGGLYTDKWLYDFATSFRNSSQSQSFDGTGLKLHALFAHETRKQIYEFMTALNLSTPGTPVSKSPRLVTHDMLIARYPGRGDCYTPACYPPRSQFVQTKEQQYMSGKECESIGPIIDISKTVVGWVFSNAGCYFINDRGTIEYTACSILVEISVSLGGYYISKKIEEDCQANMISIHNRCGNSGGHTQCTTTDGNVYTVSKHLYPSSTSTNSICHASNTQVCHTMKCGNGVCQGSP